MTQRRVVVTGLGLVTPLAIGVQKSFNELINSKSGISHITEFDTSKFSSKIAGIVDKSQDTGFVPERYIEPKDIKKMDLFIQFGIAAAIEAIQDSGWKPKTEEEAYRTGVLVGSGIGGLRHIEKTAIEFHNGESKRVSPFFIPASLINLLSGHISMMNGYKGPNHSVVTACSTGAHAIGDAARLIKYGDADIMIAGGSEAAITPLGIAGFAAARALSTKYNDTPKLASRPWDKGHDGFVMGEGAGILVLEDLEHAKKRGAKIYAEILGYGLTGDAYHITSPHPDGEGAYRAMNNAIIDAKITPEMINYVNAHGTSTQVGDKIELDAVQKLFSNNKSIMMSSTKSSIGHLLGATGSVEAIFTILSICNKIAPPTLNLEDPIDGVKIDLVPNHAKELEIKYAISNSFGFGGTNASLVLGKF